MVKKMPEIKKTQILSVGSHLPPQVVTSDELFEEIKSDQYGIPTDWMSITMGIKERRVAKAGTPPSTLAIKASKKAIATTNINVDDIGMVIFCGIERDNPEPATAHIIQNALGVRAQYAYDLANACFGFVDAMKIASSFINNGDIKYALISTGEVSTKMMYGIIDRFKSGGLDIKKARNMIGALSVGDAGGAIIIGKSEDQKTGFELFNSHIDSKHTNKCIYKMAADGLPEGQMLMGPITNAILRAHEGLIDDTLNKLGWEKFDWLLSHQMGQRPFDKLSLLKGVQPSKMIKTFPKLGNITTATFPINWEKLTLNDNVRQGQKIGCCFAGSGLAVGQLGYTF